MIKKCNKGFTLIEVIISMSIMGMVMMVIYAIFFTNYKTMNTVNTGVELQSQGERSMNYLVDTGLSASKVNYIKDESGIINNIDDDIAISDNINISEISFTTVKYDKATSAVAYNYIEKIILQPDSSNSISPTEGLYKMYRVEEDPSDPTSVKKIFLASFISSIKVKPFGENSTGTIIVGDIKGIEFTITLKKLNSGKAGDLMTKTITNKVKFRN